MKKIIQMNNKKMAMLIYSSMKMEQILVLTIITKIMPMEIRII